MAGEFPLLESLPSLRYPSPVTTQGDAATATAAAGSSSAFQQAQAEIRAVGQRRQLEPSSDGLPSTDDAEVAARNLRQARVAFHESFQTQTPQVGQAQAFASQRAPFFFGGTREEPAEDARDAGLLELVVPARSDRTADADRLRRCDSAVRITRSLACSTW